MRDNLSFNFDKDFEFVATTMRYSLVLAANPKLPFKTMAEMVAYGKANPGKLTYSTSGISGELAAALILKAVGVQAVQIPYGGSAPAAAAAVNGTTDMVIAAPASTQDHIASGTLRPIVITDVARNPRFPDTPTLMDAGIPDLKNVSILLYNGVLAPAGTPAPILERWRTEIQAMLKDPAVIERLGRINYEVSYLGGAGLQELADRRFRSLEGSRALEQYQADGLSGGNRQAPLRQVCWRRSAHQVMFGY